MTNADERKKLLAQIAELEKNSVNYFDVEKEFFLIDSDNLSQVRPKLYGYSIQRNGIYEDDNLTTEAIAGLDGRGCYVYVEVKDGKLTIKQDLNGSWGIYLFRHGDYFALSNSFFRLLDHVKFKYPLTVNRDYFHYLWIETICSNAYSETAVNEIQLVERSTILHIDTTKKALEIERIDYKEHTLSLDSAEGIATLDHWADFWCDVLRGVMQHTQFLIGDLSGGFDSRFSLLLAIRSGISLDKIKINSIKDDLHSHKEDYEIATKIAEHYAFKLNQSMDIGQVLNYSFSDILNINLYNCLLFTNLPKPWPCKSINKTYRFGGGGGETIRSNWIRFGTLKNFIQNRAFRTLRYSRVLSQELANSTETILNSAFRDIGARYGIEDKEGLILQYLVKETQCRNHFGKNDVGNYFLNIIQFSPAIDPNIRMLELSTQECPDLNLLSALIFNRYEPDLLTFPFEGNRSIAPETIDYAKKINERFPRHVITDKVDRRGVFYLQPRDTQTEKILAKGHNNKVVSLGTINNTLKITFSSSKIYGLFSTHFDDELYYYAMSYQNEHDYERFRYIYPVLGIARVLEDVEISQRNRPLYQDIRYFLEQDFTTIPRDYSQIIRKFKEHFTARIDIKLMSAIGDFQILSCSDDKAIILKPEWFQKNGIGYLIQSCVGDLKIVVKSTVTGEISVVLRGRHVLDPKDNSKLIPYWIDYTKFIVNENPILNTLTPIWCSRPYYYDMKITAGEEIKIHVEWQPHRSDT